MILEVACVDLTVLHCGSSKDMTNAAADGEVSTATRCELGECARKDLNPQPPEPKSDVLSD